MEELRFAALMSCGRHEHLEVSFSSASESILYTVNHCALRALSGVAAIFAYIEIAVLRVLAFSEDLLRYVNDLRSGVLRHHYIIAFLYIFGVFY